MHKLKYFEEREKFDITVYLKNPMVLMGLMMAFMAFVMPKMVSALLCSVLQFLDCSSPSCFPSKGRLEVIVIIFFGKRHITYYCSNPWGY